MKKPYDVPQASDAFAGLRIALMGTHNWLKVVAEVLRRAGVPHEVFDIRSGWLFLRWLIEGDWRRFDAVHHICGLSWYARLAFALLRKPVLWHWIGTDVYTFQNHTGVDWRNAINRLVARHRAETNLAGSPELAQELKRVGIRAQIVRLLPVTVQADVEPLPEEFSVLNYWLEGRREFYGGDIVRQLAGEFSKIKFQVVGVSGVGESFPPNVTFLGFQKDMLPIYSNSSVLIRLPKHDSISAMVLEMLARGRYVIYNKRLKGCHYASTLDEARKALMQIRNIRRPNTEGADMVRKHFSPDKEAEVLAAIYRRMMPHFLRRPHLLL